MAFRGSVAATLLHFCLLAMVIASSTSCLVRRRIVTRKGGQPTQVLLNTTKENLIQQIATQYAAVATLSGTVDMVPAIGTANKGKITEYKDVRAYIRFRTPSDTRNIAPYPRWRNKAFHHGPHGS